MRFQDAAHDARAVVYAGIQADPLVARAAELLATASHGQRILARNFFGKRCCTVKCPWPDDLQHTVLD